MRDCIVQLLRDTVRRCAGVETHGLADPDFHGSSMEPALAVLSDFFESGESDGKNSGIAFLHKQADTGTEVGEFAFGSVTFRKDEHMEAVIECEAGVIEAAPETGATG